MREAQSMPGLGRIYAWEVAVVLVATAVAVIAALAVLPAPREYEVGRALVRAPSDINSLNIIGLYIDDFELVLTSPEVTAAVVQEVPEIPASRWQDRLSISRRGTSVLFDVALEHDDGERAAEAIDIGLREAIRRMGELPLEGPRQRVENARVELDAATAEVDAFIAEHGLYDPGGIYSGLQSDIRSLERQIREATLLRFGSAYIAGLEQARADAVAELPRMIELIRINNAIQARIDEARNDVFAAEDVLIQAQADFELHRSAAALIQTPPYVTEEVDLLGWLQRVVLAGAVAFITALLGVVAYNALLRARARRAAEREAAAAERRRAAEGDDAAVDVIAGTGERTGSDDVSITIGGPPGAWPDGGPPDRGPLRLRRDR